MQECLDELLKDLLFHEQYAAIRKLQEQQSADVLKFVYRYKKQADPEELRQFLNVMQRMTAEDDGRPERNSERT